MSRSRKPKCPNGRGCGVCHLGKPCPPIRDIRHAYESIIELEVSAEEARIDKQHDDSLNFNACDCGECIIERARAEIPVGLIYTRIK